MSNKAIPKPSIDVEFLMELIGDTAAGLEKQRDLARRHALDSKDWAASARTMRQFGKSITEGLRQHPERFNNA